MGFIPGIYNYCDRWCDRCEQKLHCMSFVMGSRLEEKGGFSFDHEVIHEDEGLWTHLKGVFESTYEVLQELAVERGIEVEDIYASENINREFWGEDFEIQLKDEKNNPQIENSDIIRITLIYEDLAEKCLEKILIANPEKKKEKRQEDAFEVVNWYVDFMQSKMRRALYAFHLGGKKEEEFENYNGSAKVVLLAIDRSIKAWKEIAVSEAEWEREIGHLLVVLAQLQKDIEKQFPKAREFKRPGFEKE